MRRGKERGLRGEGRGGRREGRKTEEMKSEGRKDGRRERNKERERGRKRETIISPKKLSSSWFELQFAYTLLTTIRHSPHHLNSSPSPD